MWIWVFSPLTIGNGFPTVVEDVLLCPDLHFNAANSRSKRQSHFFNSGAWQHTRVTGAERKRQGTRLSSYAISAVVILEMSAMNFKVKIKAPFLSKLQ